MEDPPFAVARPAVRGALAFAAEMHASQLRDADRAPFILHPLEVAALLSGRDVGDAVVAAGILHDVVENTPARIEDVRERFGERVAALVAAVTEDRRSPTTRPARRRCATRSGRPARTRSRSTRPTRSRRRASCAHTP